MKKKVLLFITTFLIILPTLVLASNNNESDISSEENKPENIAVESGENKDIKAEIVTRPEDLHPNGINMEVGTASYWLEVEATISGENGATISYQWYESQDGTMENIVPIEGETQPIFVPEQKIGTTYYCVGVITTVNGNSTIEYTKLLEATFTQKVVNIVWITDVATPAIGKEIENKASQYTEYDLNSYYGYDIKKVYWTPDDKFFEDGKDYTINIDIEFWEDVKIANDIDVRVNDEKAEIKITGENTATVSYKFENDKINNTNNNQKSGDSTNLNYQKLEEKTMDVPTIILTTVCIIVIVFSIIVIIKRNKS